MGKCQILLTNDDGIQSPGLWAAAEALSELGFVTVAAPRDQSSGMGRSLPSTSDGIIRTEVVQVRGKEWSVLRGWRESGPGRPARHFGDHAAASRPGGLGDQLR